METQWTETLIAAKIQEMKAGQTLIPGKPNGFEEPLQSPEQAASEAFTSGVVNTTMDIYESARDKVGATADFIAQVTEWLPWVGAGLAALYVAPMVLRAVKSARR